MTGTIHRPFAVITGGSNGIGLELAPQVADNGYDLLIAAQDEQHLRDAALTLGAGGVQADTYAETQPIEDASVEWSAQDSQYRTVATLRLPRQRAYSPERIRYFDEVMSFRPGHSLAAHRPLGSVMRARLQAYQAHSAFRHRENGVAEANPVSIEEIPA